MAATSLVSIAALAPTPWEPWMSWATLVQEENACLLQEVATLKAALHEAVRSAEGDSTMRQTTKIGQGECKRRHLTLDSLVPRTSCSLGDESPPKGHVTPETLSPQSSQASVGRTTPRGLTPPPGLSFPAEASLQFASGPPHAYFGPDVTVPPCASPQFEVSLEDSLAPRPSFPIATGFPPVGFKPPPGLPTPPGLVMPPPAGLAQSMPRVAQSSCVDQVSVAPQTRSLLATDLKPIVSEITASYTRAVVVSEQTANGLSVLSRVVDGARCTQVGWRIRDPLRKLRATCGFPIVSPEFAIDGRWSLRLGFIAGQKWEAECSKTHAKRRNKPTKTNQLPLYGAIQLKTLGDFSLKDSWSHASFNLGGMQQGQLELTSRTVQGVDLLTDWRAQLEGEASRDLLICVEFTRA